MFSRFDFWLPGFVLASPSYCFIRYILFVICAWLIGHTDDSAGNRRSVVLFLMVAFTHSYYFVKVRLLFCRPFLWLLLRGALVM